MEDSRSRAEREGVSGRVIYRQAQRVSRRKQDEYEYR